MTRATPISDVVNASHRGIRVAQKNYESWSNGDWLWQAPEYLTTVCLAKELAKAKTMYVSLEYGAKKTFREAGGLGVGRPPHNIRLNGRFDILLRWKTDKSPRALIEVKCQVVNIKKIKSDLERIEKVIIRNKKNTSIQFGAVVFYTSCKKKTAQLARTRILSSLKNILDDSKNLFEKSCTVLMKTSRIYIRNEEKSAWAASILIMKPK